MSNTIETTNRWIIAEVRNGELICSYIGGSQYNGFSYINGDRENDVLAALNSYSEIACKMAHKDSFIVVFRNAESIIVSGGSSHTEYDYPVFCFDCKDPLILSIKSDIVQEKQNVAR